MSNKLFGSYIGIVIDALDPEHLGRVQVFIPSLDCNLISSFTGQSSYIFPGNDTGGDLSIRDLNLLKKSCVWAYTSQPIFGGSSIGRVNESTGKTTVSDSVTDTEAFSISENGEAPKAFGAKFNYYGARHDAFAVPSNTLTQKGNFTGEDYFPENYINSPKGSFSLPNVGARVLVTFIGGIKNQAVITGKVPFAREYQMMME